MSDQYIVEHCSPTLAGIKTGNLFSISLKHEGNINKDLSRINITLRKKGICAILAKKTKDYALIYLYRPLYLEKDLSDPEAVRILEGKGYKCGNSNKCIIKLIHRLYEDEDFPHEIGLFLGYPPEDVRGFMNDPAKGVKCTGFWKVYGNEKKAQKLFGEYRKCTCFFKNQLKKGKTLEQLTVG